MVSFAILLSSLLSATVVYGVLLAVSKVVRSFIPALDGAPDQAAAEKPAQHETPIASEATAAKNKRKQLFASFISSVITSMTVGFTFSGVYRVFGRSEYNAAVWEHRYSLAIFIIAVACLALIAYRPALVKWFALILTLVLIGAICVALFHQPTYTKFLATIKYGGAVPITVKHRDGSGAVIETEGGLFLTTSRVYIILENKQTKYIEIETTKVDSVTYPAPQLNTDGS